MKTKKLNQVTDPRKVENIMSAFMEYMQQLRSPELRQQKPITVRKLELVVRSLNLQRAP